MSNIINRLKAHSEDLFVGKGATPAQIAEAETALGVRFADDYRSCLLEFGVVAFDGHELTGITAAPRINVVEVTKKQRGLNSDIPPEMYVIEEANVDDIVIWQDCSCVVFGNVAGSEPIKLANNLSEFLNA